MSILRERRATSISFRAITHTVRNASTVLRAMPYVDVGVYFLPASRHRSGR